MKKKAKPKEEIKVEEPKSRTLEECVAECGMNQEQLLTALFRGVNVTYEYRFMKKSDPTDPEFIGYLKSKEFDEDLNRTLNYITEGK